MAEPRSVGDRIKSARIGAGLSKAELARRVRADASHISKLESDDRQASLRMLEAIAREVGVTEGWLRGVERSSQQDPSHEATSSTLREVPMPALLQQAQDDLARIFFQYKPDSEEWRTVVQVIRLAAARTPDKKMSPVVPQRRGR